MRKLLFLLTLTCLSLSVFTNPSKAQTEDPFLSLPDGQVILSISATESTDVEQDLLVANLIYTVTNREAKVVQNDINTIMAKALERAKKESAVKINTGMYQVYEVTDPRTKEKQWRGQQSLTLQSKEADDILNLTKDLQTMGLNMNGLSYILDPKTAVTVQDSLMEDALKQLQQRADRAAKALGKSSAELRDVNVQGQNVPYHHMPMARGAMMEMAVMDMAAPVADAGETTLTLTVTARALLKP